LIALRQRSNRTEKNSLTKVNKGRDAGLGRYASITQP